MRATALLLVFACMVRAGEEKPEPPPGRDISFLDAVQLGLAYNLGLKSARVDALLARLEVEQQEAAWDVVLDSFLSGGETRIPSRSALAGAAVVDTDSWNFNLGVTKPFRVGPTLGLVWRTDRTFTNSTFSTINPAYDTALEVNLTVPLLRGRGRTVQEADLRASQAGAIGARFALLNEAEALVEQIAQAYWDLVYLQDRVTVLEKSLEVAREIEEAERRKLRPEIGRSTPLDVTQAHAETASRESDLIGGRFDAANASDDLRRLVLPFTGSETDRIVLRAVAQPGETADVPDLARLVATAVDRRPDLRQTDMEIQRLRETVVKAQDQLRVQFDLGANITWRGVADSFGDSATSTLQGQNPSAAASLTVTWTLGRRAAKAALRRAQLALEQARINRQDQVNGVVADVRRAHRALQTSIEALEALAEEVAAADASLAGERLRLTRGSSTVIDVARLERNFTESRLRLVQTKTGLEQARLRIYRVTGTLLDEFELELGTNYEVRRIKG